MYMCCAVRSPISLFIYLAAETTLYNITIYPILCVLHEVSSGGRGPQIFNLK